jgi:uncharacterized membrane protein
MALYLCALLIGVIAGLRAMTAPAVTAWAAHLRGLSVAPFGFMQGIIAPAVFSVLALLEIVNDKRPTTPSRKIPMQFGARIVSGAFSGAVIGAVAGTGTKGVAIGGVAGAVGAVIGTYGGAAMRGALAKKFGKDLPAALIEDAIAVFGGLAITMLP